MILAAAVLGAAVGAGLDSASPNLAQAQSLIVVNPSRGGGAGEVRLGTDRVAQAAVSRYVAAEVRDALGLFEDAEELRRDVSADADPDAGLVVVTARSESAADAVRIADSFAAEATRVGEANGDSSLNVLGDFEDVLDWQGGASDFSTQAASLRLDGETARFGHASLRVVCGARQRCGAWIRAYQAFTPEAIYGASGWARLAPGSDRPVSAAMFLGSGSDDGEVGRFVDLTSSWQQLDVSWVPEQSSATSQVGIVTQTGSGPTSFDLDGVVLADETREQPPGPVRPPSPAALQRALAPAASLRRFPARPVGEESTSSTVRAALLGALAGLGAALAAVGVAVAATRRAPERAGKQ
jgi:hypothetical protein